MEKDRTTAGDANWRAACESEAQARDAWQSRYGWIKEEYKVLTRELEELRARRPKKQDCEKVQDSRTVRPFPVTTAGDIGWLSGNKNFQLEVYGPYPNTGAAKPPIQPPGLDGIHGY